MSKAQKIWLIIAVSLVAVGCLIFVGGLAAFDFDFSKLSTEKYETTTYEVSGDFDKISIDVATTDITFAPSDDGKCKVVCYEEEKVKHSAEAKNGTLVIKTVDTRKWYECIGVTFESMKMTVYLPKDEYVTLSIITDTGNVEIHKDFVFENTVIESDTGYIDWDASVLNTLKIDTDMGSIKADNISAGEINLTTTTGNISINSASLKETVEAETDTGRIQLTNINCKSVNADSDTGDITLKNTVAAERFAIESDTGDVRFEDSDAASIFVKTDTGNVTGALLSEKVFITKSSTGRVDVPDTISGGRCEITTDTGDIKIDVH